MTSLASELCSAEAAAIVTGEILRDRFGSAPIGVRIKDGMANELVSDADLAADAAIRSVLCADWPNDGVISEEAEPQVGTSGRNWVIDPLDGTTNFLYGLPYWGISIALEDRGEVLVGAVYDPMRDELFSSAHELRGAGAVLGISRRSAVEESVVACLLNAKRMSAESVRSFLSRLRAKREFGATALELAWVAAGRLDGCVYYRSDTPWDWLAGERLVIDAGGVVLPSAFPGADVAFAGAPGLAGALCEAR